MRNRRKQKSGKDVKPGARSVSGLVGLMGTAI